MKPSLKGGRDFTRLGNSTSLHDLFADYQEVDASCNAAVNTLLGKPLKSLGNNRKYCTFAIEFNRGMILQ